MSHEKAESKYSGSPKSKVESFYHKPTGSWTYLVIDSNTRQAVVIDPVLDFDPSTAQISAAPLKDVVAAARSAKAQIVRILETHVHADHLSGCRVLRQILLGNGGDVAHIPIAIGSGIRQVQQTLAPRYDIPDEYLVDAFDEYLEPNTNVSLGNSQIHVRHLPGHTPDHLGYHIGNDIFVGDVIFMPDIGTARTDFHGGASLDLARSLEGLLTLPRNTCIHVGHDYPTASRTPRSSVTLQEQIDGNIHLKALTEGHFIEDREQRNAMLGQPRLLHPSLQFNLAGGRLGRKFFVYPLADLEREVAASFPEIEPTIDK